jgi:hypothetical protein
MPPGFFGQNALCPAPDALDAVALFVTFSDSV